MSKHLEHNSPLRHLVKQVLHKDRDLRANVVRLRFKRRKKSLTNPTDAVTQP